MAEQPGVAPTLHDISAVVDGWMTVTRGSDGVVSLRVGVGEWHRGALSGDVVEVVINPEYALRIAQALTDEDHSATVEAGDVADACVALCHIGFGRRRSTEVKMPSPRSGGAPC